MRDVRGCRSSRRAQLPDTTSPPSCHTAPYEEPPGPNTAERERGREMERGRERERNKSGIKQPVDLKFKGTCLLDWTAVPLTSGVPQNVEVVPSGSTPSLHRPKSVSTTCP